MNGFFTTNPKIFILQEYRIIMSSDKNDFGDESSRLSIHVWENSDEERLQSVLLVFAIGVLLILHAIQDVYLMRWRGITLLLLRTALLFIKADVEPFPLACDPCCDFTCENGYCWTWSCFCFQKSIKSQKIVTLNAQAFFASIRVVHSHQLKTSQSCVRCHGICYCYPGCGICQLWL